MDRTEEIKELMVRLVTLLAEEHAQMHEEISDLRKAVESLAGNSSGMSPETLPSGNMQQEEKRDPEQEAEQTPEPVPGLVAESGLSGPAPVPFRFKDFPGDEEDAGAAESAGTSGLSASSESSGQTEEPVKSTDVPRSGVLRPRSREEQINDTSQWGMFFNSDIDGDVRREVSDTPAIGELFSVQETAAPKEPSWMSDIPGQKVDSVYEALTNNDRFQFIRDLFDDDDEQFALSMDRIDRCHSFRQVVSEMRVAFPDWDESSPLVYQFYMMVRRKFR